MPETITDLSRRIAELVNEGATVSVKDFGAVGDGIHDDTEAIQAAIDFVPPTPPYAESLDLLVPVVEAWCRRHAIEGDIPNFGITFVQQPTDEEAWWNAEIWELDDVWGFTPAEALAHALVAAVDRWGW